METTTVILLSVLSTLSVVAIIALVVVSFNKLGRKVNTLEDILSREITQRSDELNSRMNNIVDEFSIEFANMKKFVDSRCDKLDAKIKSSGENAAGTHVNAGNSKQVLQG